MKFLFMLVGILLTLLGVVSASPIATPTTHDNPTSILLGPRRNGYSDLPSSVEAYNAANALNAVPRFVTASDPQWGHNAIIYNQGDMYTALMQGYEVLQRTRDRSPGDFVTYSNIQYPARINRLGDGLAETTYGRYFDSDTITMYMWPLLWTNGWTGHNQNPGQDRIVFNEQGIYLGVITRRPSAISPNGAYRWCPPTDIEGHWVAEPRPEPSRWNFSGVPPDGPDEYLEPADGEWNVAGSQLEFWQLMHHGAAYPPFGNGGDIRVSSTESDKRDDPLDFPPADNSTGLWHTYEPSNATTHLTDEFVAADCEFAHDHGAVSYQQSCHTHWRGGSTMQVRITVSGTGQNTKGWCQGVMDNMHRKCGGNFNLDNKVYFCDEIYPGTATFSQATSEDDPEHEKYYFGIDMHFTLRYPWAESDADHTCMSEAVEAASCAGANVKSSNGKWCRNILWVPSTRLAEWSNDMGPP